MRVFGFITDATAELGNGVRVVVMVMSSAQGLGRFDNAVDVGVFVDC